MSIVGSVTVRVVPSFTGVHKQIAKQVTGAASQAGSQAGRSMSRAMSASLNLKAVGGQIQAVGKQIRDVGSTLTKSITVPLGGATLAAGGLVATLGWGRLKSVDTAQSQLRGLGYETEDVERISANLVDALEGGMLTMGEATSAAAAGMAAGVQEGEELTRYIQLLDAATAGSNGTFDEMNQIFARIQGSGQLMTNELQMIEQRMPGFSAAVADHLGVPQEEMREMVSQGRVSADDFLDIMDDFGGGMATEYAKSWEGMVQNTMAYIGIIGENILQGVFQMSKDEIADFIEVLSSDEAQQWASDFGESVAEVFSRVIDAVRGAVSWWQDLDSEHKSLILRMVGIAVAAGPVLKVVGRIVGAVGGLVSAVGGLVGAFARIGPILLRATGPIGLIISGLITMWATSDTFRDAVIRLAEVLWDSIQQVWTALEPLVSLLGDVLVSVLGAVADALGVVVGFLADSLARIIETVIIPVLSWLVDILVVVIDWIVGLGDESTTQGAIFMAIWESIRDTVIAVWEGFLQPIFALIGEAFRIMGQAISAAWTGVIKPAWDALSTAISWLWENVLSPTFGFIGAAWGALSSGISAAWTGVIKPTWDALSSAATWLWENVLGPVFGFIGDAWDTLSSGFKWAYDNVIKPTVDFFSNAIEGLWDVADRVFGWIGDKWDGLKSIFSDAWGNIKGTLTDFKDWVSDIFVGAFEWAVDAVGDIWDGIKAAFAKPMYWIADNTWNRFAGALNSVFDFLNLSWEIPTLDIPQYAKGGRHEGGWAIVGEEGPELVNFSNPGRVYTAEETREALAGEYAAAGKDVHPDHERALMGSSPSESLLPAGNWLKDGAKWVWDNTGGRAWDWARGQLANGLQAALDPLISAMRAWSDGSGIRSVITGLPLKLMEGAVEWARGQDDKDAANGDADFAGEMGSLFRPSSGPITSWYGPRWGSIHSGIDIAGGGPTYAAYNGVVQKTGWNILPGRTGIGILLGHGNGVQTYYGHNPSMHAVRVSPGDEVTRGQTIGRQGATGNVTGIHLHWERLVNGRAQNVNSLFRDKGGLIYPGMNQVLNETGKAEYVFNQQQFENLNRMAASSGSAGGMNVTQNVYSNGSDYRDAQDLRMTMRRESKRMKAGV